MGTNVNGLGLVDLGILIMVVSGMLYHIDCCYRDLQVEPHPSL